MQKFNYHTHTYRCKHADYEYSEEDCVEDFIKYGFTKMAFTDHSPYKNPLDSRTNMRMDYSEKEAYLQKINELKENYKDVIEVKSGLEVEYSDFDKDELLELKKEFDFLILGQHYIADEKKELFIFGKNNECNDDMLKKYYESIENAIKLGIPDIIAHPDFYMLSRNTLNEADEEFAHNLGKIAEKYDVPLEINLNNIYYNTYYNNRIINDDPIEIQKERLSSVIYPNKSFWQIISNYNVKVLYGADIHRRGQIDKFNILVDFAKIIIGEETINKLNFVEDV